MKNQEEINWGSGAEHFWKEINSLYAGIIAATYEKRLDERRRLRRKLFSTTKRALRTARFKGRLLGVLGNSSLRADLHLRWLRQSFRVSKRECDYYNCLLVADSLMTFFIEWRYDAKRARYWMKQAQRLLEDHEDAQVRKSVASVSRILTVGNCV